MSHHAYFTDVYILNGATIEFTYTKLDGNRWSVRASINAGHTVAEFYSAIDEKPESLEELFATHRFAVSNTLIGWAQALLPKPKEKSND